MGGYIAAIPLVLLITITLNEWALVYYELSMMTLFCLLPGLQHTLIEISIPLAGSLRHQDSMGNKHVIRAGEIQVMSAGTGITHSEHNNSEHEEVNFLQIWVMPKALNIIPQYDQRRIDERKINNHFQLIIAPMGTANHIGINQDAFFSLARIDAGQLINYEKYNKNNGVYFFITPI